MRLRLKVPGRGTYHTTASSIHTKPGNIRVVFDAAALHDGISLNRQLNRRPDLTNSLLGVLLSFRQERIVLAADMQSLFLQVKVPTEDADALLFLWLWSNLKYANPTNQPLNEGSCQLSVTFTILWVSSVRLCCVGCAKKIMQCQLGWDDPVPQCELAHWERWKSELW